MLPPTRILLTRARRAVSHRYLHTVHTTFTGSDTISDSLRAYMPDTPHAVLTLEDKVPPLYSPTGIVEFFQVGACPIPVI